MPAGDFASPILFVAGISVEGSAPGATSVQIDLGRRYEMTKDENGVWTGTTAPQDVGFHYYQIIVDGTAMPDPGTVSFFGAGRWGSGIEIPSGDMDIWQTQDVPQGSIVEKYYWSAATESMRHCYVYLPNEYDKNPDKKYPVLYLQHGNAENEYGWSVQGHTGQIMDNLIARKMAVPFIIVMDYGQGQNIHRERVQSLFRRRTSRNGRSFNGWGPDSPHHSGQPDQVRIYRHVQRWNHQP